MKNRVAAIPATVKELVKKGMTVNVEVGAGAGSFINDADYVKAGLRLS